MKKSKFIGVDGCKAGWFFVCLSQTEEVTFGLFPGIEQLWQSCRCENTLFLIDIPIGLPSKGIPARQCDKDARRILSPKRHSSVFSPPSRESLYADNYEAACRINQKITGRKISRQAWGIAPKILEKDTCGFPMEIAYCPAKVEKKSSGGNLTDVVSQVE